MSEKDFVQNGERAFPPANTIPVKKLGKGSYTFFGHIISCELRLFLSQLAKFIFLKNLV